MQAVLTLSERTLKPVVVQDRGHLVKVTKDEVSIAVQAKTGEEMRLHAPRWQFRIRAINKDGARL